MLKAQFDCIKFHQYGSDHSEDSLLLFAAPAKRLASWAGIPMKGWQLRMLFQRPITPGRDKELKEFWETASSPQNNDREKFILGLTAIVVAIQGEPKIENGKIILSNIPVVDVTRDPIENIQPLANLLFPRIKETLTGDQKEFLDEFTQDPFQNFPNIDHDYVFQFALQLAQMKSDPEKFVHLNEIDSSSQDEIVCSMESLCRPATIVDGQHHLWEALHSNNDIILPVVAVPNCEWMEQIHQFVVINEKAKNVETSLLTDIFGVHPTFASSQIV